MTSHHEKRQTNKPVSDVSRANSVGKVPDNRLLSTTLSIGRQFTRSIERNADRQGFERSQDAKLRRQSASEQVVEKVTVNSLRSVRARFACVGFAYYYCYALDFMSYRSVSAESFPNSLDSVPVSWAEKNDLQRKIKSQRRVRFSVFSSTSFGRRWRRISSVRTYLHDHNVSR